MPAVRKSEGVLRVMSKFVFALEFYEELKGRFVVVISFIGYEVYLNRIQVVTSGKSGEFMIG